MKKLLQIVFLSLILIAGAYARMEVPLVNYENVVISTASGKKPSLTEVKSAILNAAKMPLSSAGGQTWNIREIAPGQMVGSLIVRNKHQMSISINYSSDTFSVTYKDSVNMHYAISTGEEQFPGTYQPYTATGKNTPANTPVIHPYYNAWVKTLVNNIRIEFQRL